MKRKLTSYLFVLFGIGLLASLGIWARPSSAQAISIDPFVLRFVEVSATNASQSTSLVFVVKDDGSTLLVVDRKIPNAYDIYFAEEDVIWQQTGKLTPEQLDKVKAARQTLSSAPDQYWAGKNYAFDFPISSKEGDNKRVQFNNKLKRLTSAEHLKVLDAVLPLIYIRDPFVPLVTFGWSGGFSKRSTLLTVLLDGRMTYEDRMRQTAISDQMTDLDLDLVRQLIRNPSFKRYPPVAKQNCTNCWVYSIVTITADGLKTAEFDQAALELAPKSLKTLVTFFSDLSAQEALIRITTTPHPAATVSPTATSAVKPTSTPESGATLKPSPTAIGWQSSLTEADAHIEMDVLHSEDEVIIGALKRFQLVPGQVPTECAVFVIRGPIALAIGLFGPGWVERRDNMTDAQVEQRLQEGVDALSQYCDRDKIKIMRVP